MTYLGYMALANDEGETLELVNAARVKAYTDNLAPSIGLRGCDDCEGLPAALGEEYTTPIEDFAPWYDPTDPETGDFYGVYPLGFEGIDDSTRTVESAELSGDGSVVVGSRFAGQDILVTGMAFAKNEAALYAGISWLNSALNGTEEGRCFGDRLNVFSSCPPVQDLPPGFATPYTLVNPPSAAELAAWTTTSGTKTSSAAGVNFQWTAGDPLKTACRTITGLIPGEQYQLRLRPETYGNYYVSMGRGCAERYTNLMPNPRLAGQAMSLNGSTSVDTYPTTGAPDGGSFFSRLVVVPNTTSPMTSSLTPGGLLSIPISPDTTYTFSWYSQKIGAGGPASRMDWSWFDSSGATITVNNGSGMTSNATWQRHSQTVTSPPTAAYIQVRLVWTGTAIAGQVLNLAQTMLSIGSSAPSYIDGTYPDARWLGAAGASASTVERNVDYQTIFGWGTDHAPPTEPTVLDFTANEETMYLSIQSLGVASAPPTVDLQVQQASVRRTARPGVVAFGTGNDAVPPSDGWTHRAPSNMRVDWTISQSSVVTQAILPVGATATYLTTHGPERTVYGLRPGSRYRLMIEFDTSWNSINGGPQTALSPNVTVSNASGTVVTYTNDNPGTFQYFWVVEFTATATSSLIGFHPGSNLSVGSQGAVRWTFHEYMVEEILATDTVPPQPGRNEQRTMYEVKASSGATITNVRKAPCGVMAQVSYGLRAGQPFKYRNPAFAGGLPAGTSTTVADIPCSDDGLPQLINFAYNGSVETNATDWLAGGTGTITSGRVASATARVGGFVFQATAPATTGNKVSTVTAYYNVSSVTGGPIPLGGDTITVSLWVRTIAATWNGTHTWVMQATMSGFPPINFSGNVNITVANQWYRVNATFTLPFNVPLTLIEAQIQTPATPTTGGGIQIDGFQIERGSVPTTPWDETFPNTEWSATPNTSALLRDQDVVDISADPDCPTPPTPPSPPEIDDGCVEVPSTYNRTVVDISETAVPRNLTAYPLITLTAGAQAVRQARIRFWENPGNLDITQVDPCSYDGEIIVSYLAAGATMVIDGVLHEATVSLPGFPDTNANHVLYGPDGGPVDWPELSGGIPYLVTLELDSSGTYSDTLMTIDLVVRD